MLLFPFLALFFGIVLLFSPVMLWKMAAPRWHRTLAISYAVIALAGLVVWVRRFVRERAELARNPAASAHWRWLPRTNPEMFRRNIVLYLSMRGWHIASSGLVAGDRVQVIANKERCSIVLLFVGPLQPGAGADDVRLLHAASNDAPTMLAALVTAVPCGQEALAAIQRPDLLLLRYADLARLDEIVSFAF
jgi:hypothetical protein